MNSPVEIRYIENMNTLLSTAITTETRAAKVNAIMVELSKTNLI